MNFGKLLLPLFISLISLNLWAHGCEEGKACIEIDSDTQSINAGKISYEFNLIDEKNDAVITESDLAIQHEKILHMFVYDPALKEFQHVHPVYNGSSFVVDLDFSVNGNYYIYAQGLLKKGSLEFIAPIRLKVTNGKPENAVQTLGNIFKGESDNSVVELTTKEIRAGQMVMPVLTFSRKDGSYPEITPWLGAKAHVVATQLNGNNLLHVHPMDMSNPFQLMIHTTFPKVGEYRLWIQFIDGGILKTIPLSVKVVK